MYTIAIARASRNLYSISHRFSASIERIPGYVLGALLLFSGSASAAITVNMEIQNPIDANGNFTVIDGSNVIVEFFVAEDTDNELNKKDRIQLLRVSDDSVVSQVSRGKKKSGSVSLKVRNSEGEALYVQYMQRGSSGTVITRLSHPDDDDTPLLSIARASVDDLTLAVNATNVGVASIHGHAFVDVQNSLDSYSLCQLRRVAVWTYYNAVPGATAVSCDAVAPIQLPQGRTITELRCSVYDNSPSNHITFYLRGVDITAGTSHPIITLPSSFDSNSVQQVIDTTVITPAFARIDNAKFAYYILADYSTSDFSALGVNGAIYGCSVFYE